MFRELGIDDITGLDGPWVDPGRMLIPAAHFMTADLRSPITAGRTFDLAMSLEVAEHLPAERAREFVASLTRLAPVVLFSAAVPGQGGTHHLNEQWQSYWVALFQGQGYAPIDILRHRVWADDAVEWWYAQNMLLFVRKDRLAGYPALQQGTAAIASLPLDLVHPKLYLAAKEPSSMDIGRILPALPAIIRNSLRNGLRKLLRRG